MSQSTKIVYVTEGETPNHDVIPVARMINQLMKEEKMGEKEIELFEREFVEKIEREAYDGIFYLFGDKYKLVTKIPEKAKKQDTRGERVECYFSTLIYLLSRMGTREGFEGGVQKLIGLLEQSGDMASLRLRLLMTIYNSIPASSKSYDSSKLSQQVFFSVLKYAKQHGLFHELVPYMNFFESWIAKWGAAGEECQKELFHLVAYELPKTSDVAQQGGEDLPELAFKWLQKYLRVETEISPKSLSAIKLFFQQIVTLPSVYQVESLLAIPLLQKARVVDAQVQLMCTVLEMFVAGDMDQWEAFRGKNPQFLESMEVEEAQLLKKLRVLTFCSLAQNRNEVPLLEIREKLQTEHVDDIIIEGCHYGVLIGRIDEVRQVLLVQSVLRRQFRTEEWEQVDKLLSGWMGKIGQLRVLHKTMSGAQVPN